MATPIILSTGSSSGAGTAGQGREDLEVGETVTLQDTEAANTGASYVWEFLNIPEGSSTTLVNPTTATPTFSPDISGSYWIKTTVNGIESSSEILSIPLTNTLGRIPAFEEETVYDAAGNLKGWHPALTFFMRQVDALLASSSGISGTYERRVESAVEEGSATTEQTTGTVSFGGSLVGLNAKIEEAVVGGTVTINCKIEGVTALTVVLDVGSPTEIQITALVGAHPVVAGDEVTVEVVSSTYDNAANLAAGLTVNVMLVNDEAFPPLGDGADGLTLTSVKIATHSATTGERVLVDPTAGGFNVNLPAISVGNKGELVAVKNQSDSVNPVSINPNGSDTVDGQSGYTINSAREAQILQSDGVSDWLIV